MKAAGIDLADEIFDHFKKQIAPTIINLHNVSEKTTSKLDGVSHAVDDPPPSVSIADVGAALVKCCEGLHINKVGIPGYPIVTAGVYAF
jgi:hypothetical protein